MRELKALIESEIQKQQYETDKSQKVNRYIKKAEMLDNDKALLESAKRSSQTLRPLGLQSQANLESLSNLSSSNIDLTS